MAKKRHQKHRKPAPTRPPEPVDPDIDPILEKVSRVGIDGLTTDERETLERARNQPPKSKLEAYADQGVVAQTDGADAKPAEASTRPVLPPVIFWIGGCVLIYLLTFLVYWPSMNGGFFWDDMKYVVDNEMLKRADGLWPIWFDPKAYEMQFYPITYSTLWFDYKISGTDSTVSYHLVNVAIHALNAILVWTLLQRLKVPGALFAGLLFAVHPINVESVAWITERKNVLSCMFYLLAILAWMNYSRRNGIHRYLLALFFFSCGMLSKTLVATLPFVLLLWIWWKVKKKNYRRELIGLIPMVAIGVGFVKITMWLESRNTEGHDYGLSFLDSCIIAGRALWFYIGSLLWPFQTTPIYPKWQIDPTQAWQYLLPLAYGLVLYLTWQFRQRIGHAVFIALMFFGMTHGPSLSFFQFGYLGHSFVADHFQYIPSLAVIGLVTAIVTTALRTWLPTYAMAVGCMIGVVVIAVFANVSWSLNHHYVSDQAFWEHGVETNPIHTNLSALGDVYLRQSQALTQSAQAADSGLTNDDRTAMRQEAKEKKALAYEYIERSLEDREHARGRYRLGELYMIDRNYAEAIPQFEKAIEANLGNKVRELTAGAAYMLGVSHFNLAQYDEAEPAFVQAIKVNPKGFEAHFMLGRVFLRNKQYAEAVNYLETALQLNPTYGAVERYLKSAKTQLTKEQ